MVFCPFIASSATFALKSLLYFFGELVMGFLLGNASLLPAILSHQPVHFPGTIILVAAVSAIPQRRVATLVVLVYGCLALLFSAFVPPAMGYLVGLEHLS